MPFIRVRALRAFKIEEHKIRKGELIYIQPAKARELQKAGDAEMILTRYPERLEEAREAVELEPGWYPKEPCKGCPKEEETEIDVLDSDPEL